MPSEEWKIRNFKQKWYAGETISVGIGQGAVAATPIQLARAIGGDCQRRPHGAAACRRSAGFAAEDRAGIECAGRGKDADRSQQLGNHYRRHGGGGESGWDGAVSHLQGIDFAGKTGSAQTISNALKAKMGAAGKANFKDNGWFVGVEPRRNPEIVVCALLEEGEHGYLAARARGPGDQGLRGQAAPAADQDGELEPAKVEVGAVWNDTRQDDDCTPGDFDLEAQAKSRRWRRRLQEYRSAALTVGSNAGS